MARIVTVQPEGWPRPSGYANGVIASGRVLHVAGQIGWDASGRFAGEDLLAQFAQALRNVVTVVRAAGGEPSDIARMTAYLTDLDAYRRDLPAFGRAYRDVMGRHYPAMAFVGVSGLVEARALVEIEATAVLPEEP